MFWSGSTTPQISNRIDAADTLLLPATIKYGGVFYSTPKLRRRLRGDCGGWSPKVWRGGRPMLPFPQYLETTICMWTLYRYTTHYTSLRVVTASCKQKWSKDKWLKNGHQYFWEEKWKVFCKKRSFGNFLLEKFQVMPAKLFLASPPLNPRPSPRLCSQGMESTAILCLSRFKTHF